MRVNTGVLDNIVPSKTQMMQKSRKKVVFCGWMPIYQRRFFDEKMNLCAFYAILYLHSFVKKAGFGGLFMNCIAIIPARGGSKGIPRKNVRLLGGQELISYAIANAKRVKGIDAVLVTSDDEEILEVSARCGAQTLLRDASLGKDLVTLDPVIYDALVRYEEKTGTHYDIVITMQATSPLLQASTLRRALELFLQSSYSSMLSVVNRAGLSWGKNAHGDMYPLYAERLNRQLLPAQYFETGGFLFSRRSSVTPQSRLGDCPGVFAVSEAEGIDIDTEYDWMLCEMILKRKRIVLRADGYRELGMGHIYHCLSLAYHMTGHEFMFVCKAQYQEGIAKIQENYMPLTVVRDDEEFFKFLSEYRPDIVVNDTLNTTKQYVSTLKTLVPRVVTIEDLGEGADEADAVINALYENDARSHVYAGERYICLRDEYLVARPKPFSKQVESVLVLFGGSDPTNMTKKVYDLARRILPDLPGVRFTFITGPAYDAEKNGVVSRKEERIAVYGNVKRVSHFVAQADLAFSSQGRTAFELASMGVPSIIMAHNARELTHTFTKPQNGFLNLGLSKNVDEHKLEEAFYQLCYDEHKRYAMRKKMLAHDLRSGVQRVKNIILGEE